MAYAALLSLEKTIRGLIMSSRIPANIRESLKSAYDGIHSLKDALERCYGWVTEIDELKIIEESRKLEDAVDQFPLSFNQLRRDADLFAKATKKMEANIQRSWEQRVAKMLEESIMKLCVPKTEKKNKLSPSPEEDEEMVGLSDQFLQIRDHLLTDDQGSESYQFAEIIGMAGIGKTRLALKIFHDPSIRASFERRLFVRMGRGGGSYVVYEDDKKVLQGDFKDLDWEAVTRDRKCLIVLDDLRQVTISYRECLVIDEMRGEFSSMYQLYNKIDNSMGNRILATGTKQNHGSSFKMRFLNEEESWELLRRKVFGENQDCPRELVKAGKKIAEECEGLPLLIITVAPILLSKAQKNPEAWERVAEKPDSVLEEASLQISEVLLSNYHQLTSEELKLCFLYLTAFPKKYVVWATTIRYLCYAEGFIYWSRFKGVDILVENNLVVGRQKGYSWFKKLKKACSLHCAYWYVCRREADDKKILYTINSLADGLDERVKCHRRLAIYTNVLLALKDVHESMASIATIRSLLCTGPYHPYQVPMCWDWKLLRVLSALTIRFYEFPVEVVKLICLKYLGLTCNANLPSSISELWNLQFLIVHQHSSIKKVGVVSYLPVEIWGLQKLQVLQIIGRNLCDPPRPGVVIPYLTKLLDVGVESCTKGVLEGLPKLEKLRVQIELAPLSHASKTITMSCFDHLSCLYELPSFQCVVVNPTIWHPLPPPPLSFYIIRLRSLSLSGCGYPWEDISMIAKLPLLNKLKLKSYAFRGEKWEGEGMRFQCLKLLYIEDTDLMQWTAGDETFPDLRILVMKNCHKLQEIPLFSKKSRHYVEIKLADCNPSVETFTRQRYRTYERVTVTASYSWKDEKKDTSNFLE